MNASRSSLFHGYVYVEVYLMLSFDAVSAVWICTHPVGAVLIPHLVQDSLVAQGYAMGPAALS